jgi:hypothetical protein
MLCTYCSTPNPESNRFCGECGQPLVRQQVTVPAEPFQSAFTTEHPRQTTISGPSFLGLTDTAEADETNYLLDDADERPRKSHLGWVIFSTIAIVVLAVVGWMEWQAIKTGQIAVPWLETKSAEPTQEPSTTTEASSNSNPSAADSTAPTPTDQNPQSDKTATSPDSNAVAGSSENEKPSAADKADASSDKQSDADATHAAQSRIASDAGQRRAEADKPDDSETAADTATPAKEEKATPKAKPVSAPKAPDPNQNSMLLSGEKYLYGRGVPKDCNQALIYFKAAAETNNVPAMSHLGAMYTSGNCVTPNRVAAYKWFARASETEPSNQWFSRSLNMLWRDMTPQERASVAR